MAEQERGFEEAGALTASAATVRANRRMVRNGAEKQAQSLGLDACHSLGLALLGETRP